MNTKIEDSFIASNKIIRFKLRTKAADILAVLIYKNDYWEEQRKLEWKNGKGYFFISLNDLMAETRFSKNIIAKNINFLKAAGLVHSKQQGLNKPNLYSIDKKLIEQYKTKYKGEFNKWQKKIRENNVSSSIIGNYNNNNSGITKTSIQDTTKECSTNNKNTNNKNTNNFTNRASSESSLDLENILEKQISKLRECDDKETSQQVMILFNLLCSLVPSFDNFKMSDADKELIAQIVESEISDYNLSAKIMTNINDVNEDRKENRFGNLFVGVSKMIINYNNALNK